MIKKLLKLISFSCAYIVPLYIIFDDYFFMDYKGWVFKFLGVGLFVFIIWKYGKDIYKKMVEQGKVKHPKKEMLVDSPRRPFLYISATQGKYALVFFIVWQISIYTRNHSDMMIDTSFYCLCSVGVGMFAGWLSLLFKDKEVKLFQIEESKEAGEL